MSAGRHLVPGHLSKVLSRIMRWEAPPTHSTEHLAFARDATKIGICVSGGPDSMALAYLLHNMDHPQNPGIRAFSAHAFIVDHGMRPESGSEAVRVQHSLQVMGISSTILNIATRGRINFNEHLSPVSRDKTETIARALRYQAIVNAARMKDIYQLFLGHHHDDQMETVLMKLIMQETSSLRSFEGISSRTPAPYASQTFGGHPLVNRISRFGLQARSLYKAASSPEDGIECIRPLLDFTKDQLIATCKHFAVPFASDRTNHDATYTLRNAVRHLRSHIKLPRALQDASIQRVRARAVQQANKTYEAAKQFLQKMQIQHRYPESGMVIVSFRELPKTMTDDELHAASLAMARLCELTSPINKDYLSLDLPLTTTQSILNLLSGLGASAAKQSNGKGPHCLVSKVDFRPAAVDGKIVQKGTQALQVSRQAMRRSEIITNTQSFMFKPLRSPGWSRSAWLFWDCRFWIRLEMRNLAAIQNAKLTIRPYQPEDVASVRERLQRKDKWAKFEQLLSVCAPGPVRYTMPVLLSDGQVMAFPTCNIKLDHTLPFRWEVAYPHSQRCVDFFWPGSAR